MTHRERWACAISHRTPDRAPFDLEGTNLTACHHNVLVKLSDLYEIHADTGEMAVERILERFDINFRRVGGLFSPRSALSDDSKMNQGCITDCWGVERTFTGMYWDITGFPMKSASLGDIKAFPWPDASQIDRDRLNAHARKAKRYYYDTDYVVVAEHPVLGYLELGCWMFSFDQRRRFRHAKRSVHITRAIRGSHSALVQKADRFIKGVCGIPYFHHNCGSVYRLLQSIVDMGVDILNPIQPGAFEMEPERLKDEYCDKLVFWGGIDEQKLLSFATPREVRHEVRGVCGILNQNGGYVMAPSYNIQPDVPAERIDAMFSTVFRMWPSFPLHS